MSTTTSWKQKSKNNYTVTIMYSASIILFIYSIITLSSFDSTTPVKQISISTPKSDQIPKTKNFDKSVEAVKYLQKAMEYMDKQNWKEMVEACELAIQADDTLSYPYALIGNAMNMLNDWKKAAENWKKAAELESDNYEYYYHLGFALSQLAQDQVKNSKKYSVNKEGIASFNEYLRLSKTLNPPKSQISMVHTHLGNIHKSMKTQDHQKLALDHFHQAVELNPSNELAFFNLGLLYADKFEKTKIEQDLDVAIEHIDKAIKLDPKNLKFTAIRDAITGKIGATELMASMQSDL